MISLILLMGCAQEKPNSLFTGSEAAEYEKVLEDYEEPRFKWGYIDEDGQLIIEDVYDDLREFNEGLAAVSQKGLWGYVDKSGKEVIPPRFRTVKTISEGIAVTQDLNGHFHLINSSGKIMTDTLKFENVSGFEEGMAIVEKGYMRGFINNKGKVVIEPMYETASDFKDGRALVKRVKYGFINQHGEEELPFVYDKLWYPSQGLARFKKDGIYGFIDMTSKKEQFTGYASASDFYGNYAVVHDGTTYLLIDKAGNQKSLPYAYVEPGGEEKWMYQADNKFGFLNNDGSVLCLPQYDLLMRYQEGRAGFSINDAWGYLDENGEVIIPLRYPLAWDFVNGYARIISRYGFGFIDRYGNEVLSPRYLEVRDFSEGLARIQVYK